jgi:hypothetical protein
MAQVAPEVSERSSELFEGEGAIQGKSPGQLFWARLRQDKLAFIGMFFIVIMVLLAVFANVITTNIIKHGPNEVFVRETSLAFRKVRNQASTSVPTRPDVTFSQGCCTAQEHH